MNNNKDNMCCILGSKNIIPLWYYNSLLNYNKIYYCNLQNVLHARSYRNFKLSQQIKKKYY